MTAGPRSLLRALMEAPGREPFLSWLGLSGFAFAGVALVGVAPHGPIFPPGG